MRDMAGEDWIDMLILEITVTLDFGAMDSEVIFDQKNSSSRANKKRRADSQLKNSRSTTNDGSGVEAEAAVKVF